ncbi:hypothetical protein [Cerasicoccus frondis]|uniref:hypothetical protein n=1 Tax=Cerasicoccus frondis TaxID=490090 RepID=UPI002852A2C3|nr:hypothetical protein [Cerasicoccus frondis]
MHLPRYISHYFEREKGPLLSICDLDEAETQQIIEQERDAPTGFNRFAEGKAFFDYRRLADDLTIDLYAKRFQRDAPRRPFYAVLGDADVVGGLYRDPYKIQIPIEFFAEGELTFMCPDHLHLVTLNKVPAKQHFGYQIPSDYSEAKYPYFGKLLTYEDLCVGYHSLGIAAHLEQMHRRLNWYRYLEAQIWVEPTQLRERFKDWFEVTPEPWTYGNVTYLQNYKLSQSATPAKQ